MVQTEHRLLIFRLLRHRTHLRPLHRRPDRPSVGGTRLVGLHKGSDKARVNQYGFVTKGAHLARPPMCARTGLHRHAACGPLGKKADHIFLREATIRHFPCLGINPIQLKDTLCNVRRIRRSIHGGSPFLKWLSTIPLWHSDAARPWGPFLTVPFTASAGGRCPCDLGQKA